ncbi:MULTISPECIES: sulfurtransferase TusA family protein [unclassified Sphingomonas]|uniref:sulfurtransferase TusA family protein n=1 Tax=unclassified Sphingomonas TaxID=196159 RepID=UPI000B2DC8E8|nr:MULTISPECIES: sulfurtransferase TusA family protein [unclassified Sphingomonas]
MTRIDARGMRCPWPAIRLARALRDGASVVEIAADDPRAAGELASAATAVGARLNVVGEGVFRVERDTAA